MRSIMAPPGKWNSAQILEHLFLSYKNTNFGLGKCVEKGVPLATGRDLEASRRKIAGCESRLHAKGQGSSQTGHPSRHGSPRKFASNIFVEIQKMESGFAECERRFGAVALMDHPFLGPLNADEWRKFHLVHGRHHARQIRERMKT